MNYHVKDNTSLHSNGPLNGMFFDHTQRPLVHSFVNFFVHSRIIFVCSQTASAAMLFVIFYLHFKNAVCAEEADYIFSSDIIIFKPYVYLL
jgi:hypothetical protein